MTHGIIVRGWKVIRKCLHLCVLIQCFLLPFYNRKKVWMLLTYFWKRLTVGYKLYSWSFESFLGNAHGKFCAPCHMQLSRELAWQHLFLWIAANVLLWQPIWWCHLHCYLISPITSILTSSAQRLTASTLTTGCMQDEALTLHLSSQKAVCYSWSCWTWKSHWTVAGSSSHLLTKIHSHSYTW